MKFECCREDPFTLKDANYTFYQELEKECCQDLEHVEFPTFQPIKLPVPHQVCLTYTVLISNNTE